MFQWLSAYLSTAKYRLLNSMCLIEQRLLLEMEHLPSM